MSTSFELIAELREGFGTGASRRLRRAGKLPAVLYGAGKDVVSLTLDHDQVLQNLGNEAFHTTILKVKTDKGEEQAILRAVQVHPFRPRVLHVDLQRISAMEKLHIKVPLHFIGEDVAPGVKTQGGIVSHLITDVDVACLPARLPEYLEADLSELNLNESVHLSDIKLPEGVELTALAHDGDDLAVATVAVLRAAVEEEEVEGEGEEAEAEGEGEEAEAVPAEKEGGD